MNTRETWLRNNSVPRTYLVQLLLGHAPVLQVRNHLWVAVPTLVLHLCTSNEGASHALAKSRFFILTFCGDCVQSPTSSPPMWNTWFGSRAVISARNFSRKL